MSKMFSRVQPLAIWRFGVPLLFATEQYRTPLDSSVRAKYIYYWPNGTWAPSQNIVSNKPPDAEIYWGTATWDALDVLQQWAIVGKHIPLSYPYIPAHTVGTSTFNVVTSGTTISGANIRRAYVGYSPSGPWFVAGLIHKGNSGTYTTNSVAPYEADFESKMPPNTVPTSLDLSTYGWIPLRANAQQLNPYSAHLANLLPNKPEGILFNPLGHWG